MDLYTMNENFLAMETVDEFVSAIWTERYAAAGDFQIVAPATEALIDILSEGTFLGLRGSQEVMQIKTQSIENGLMTIAGKSLVEFLDSRIIWNLNPDVTGADDRITDLVVESEKVGQAIADVVENMVINTTPFGAPNNVANLQWAAEEIPSLEIGDVDTSGDNERITFPVGPLYSSITQVAQQYGVGISLYLESANIETGYVLKFKTYTGDDHTSDGTFPLVRLQPDLDSLSDIKELRSIEFYRNVVYVYYQGIVTVHYEDPDNIPEGWDRRVMVVNATGEPVGRKVTYQRQLAGTSARYSYTDYVVGPSEITAFRAQNAKDALANNNYIRAVDGQTSPVNDYIFGTDYLIGDIIELEGFTGNIVKARITEYIRSQDKSGEREYPTISVVS